MVPLGRNRSWTSLGRTSPFLKNRDLNYSTYHTPTTDTSGKCRLDSTGRIFSKTAARKPHHKPRSAQLQNPPLHPPSHKHPGAHAAVTAWRTTARYTVRACGRQDLIRTEHSTTTKAAQAHSCRVDRYSFKAIDTLAHTQPSIISAQLPRRPIQLPRNTHPCANAAEKHRREHTHTH